VNLGYKETGYDKPTFGARNGLYEHITVEDQLGVSSDYRVPAWETKYTVDSLLQLNYHYGWSCWIGNMTGSPQYTSICTDVNVFVRDGSPGGVADILDLDSPNDMLAGIAGGKAISVAP